MRKWQTIKVPELSRHVHRHPYAALVLSGHYEEAGDLGRFRVQAGDAMLHDRFEGHLNRFSQSGAVILNVALSGDHEFRPGIRKVADPDTIVRIAEKSEEEAAAL